MTDYNALKVVDLKQLCKDRAIPQTGLSRKQQYVDALEADDQNGNDEPVDEAENGDGATEKEVNGDAAVPSNATGEGLETPAVTAKTEDTLKEPSSTPLTGTPAIDEASSDSRKRKRRSPTPPLREESVQKKLKAADQDLRRLPEDIPKPPIPSSPEIEQQAEEVMEKARNWPKSNSAHQDQTINDADVPVEQADATMQEAAVGDDAVDYTVSSPVAPAVKMDGVEDIGPAAEHAPTNALYIRNLLRPLQQQSFRDHLVSLASTEDDPSVVTQLHLDTYKSHAFAVFATTAQAISARRQLHDHIWPDETQRKVLWVDFIPALSIKSWIATENEAGRTKRFEIVYTSGTATLEEVNPNSSHRPSIPGNSGQGMPNAPTGPRSERPAVATPSTAAPAPSTISPVKSVAPLPPAADLPDFPSTTSLPKLFFSPTPADQVTSRLASLASITSSAWPKNHLTTSAKSSGVAGQLRRYTFEDCDRVVDGGPDFGGFGVAQGAGGGGVGGAYMGGRGGGGGGGYRGRGGGGGYRGGYGGGSGGYEGGGRGYGGDRGGYGGRRGW
ncbi:hypothetical protein B0A48_01815 [Cryoendolithus antarcticus]|uniref:SAP domain-containing protein n=1 Tax=Cryoendolithus antarcticus TaxID=1507870 RepID=A0A1V8TQC4_9PEZI|nr:hypothetical protein B0A48_01815 [Cryoendolithus antarcticus]